MKCIICGYETNPKKNGYKIYTYTPKTCSRTCSIRLQELQAQKNK